MLKRFPISLAIIIAIVVGTFSYIPTAAQNTPPATSSLLVKLISGLSPAEQGAVIARNGGNEINSIPALRLHVVEVPTADVTTILQKYQADPQVQSAEINKSRRVEGIPSDPLYGTQWALPKIGWDTVYGTIHPTNTAIVAVLDTGVDPSHPDLTANVDPGTSILDGLDGLHDPHGHGTWLAGIIAAVTNNNTGIAGVSPDGVRIMPVTVLDSNGLGQDSDVIAGVIWAADHHADVILMGFSNAGFSPLLQDAIDYAWSKGAVLVAAVGNDGVNTPTFPAGDRSVVGVSATDPSDLLAPSSNSGQAVFLAAPGLNIQTTNLGGDYTVISGTSASSAIVAGVAAYMKSVDLNLTNGVIVGRMARTADQAGTQAETGNGRINMARALADTGTDPVQPAGADPVGNGGPFVGPYKAAAQNLQSVSVGAQGGTTPIYGTAGSATYTVTVTTTGSGSYDVTLDVTTTLPTGATASFNPNPVHFSGGTNSRTSTLTITTNTATPASPSGAAFTVRGCDGGVGIGTCKTGSTNGKLTVSQKSVAAAVTSANKTYDGTTTATINTCTLSGVLSGDTGSVTCSASGATFADKNVGNSKTVTATGITLSGSKSGNYQLSSTTATTTANITVLGITGSITANNKVYDATTTATIATRTLSGVISGDTVNYIGGTATFADKNVGNGKTVTATGLSLSGTDASNYTVNTTASTTANITALAITGSITANNKVYDATTTATIATRALSGVISGDTVSYVGGTATFANKNVGTGKTVTATGLSLSGTDAGNYTVNSTATTTADITARTLTVTATGVHKVYDGNTTATVTLSDNRVAGDVFTASYTTATFANKNVGTGKTVSVSGISISGTDAGNYTANTTASTTANITARALTVSATGVNKVYDGTTTATVTLSDDRVSGDSLTTSYTTATFADKHVGTGKTVSVSGISISGTDASNYTVNSTTTTTADITARALTVSATGVNKVYDGTTAATVTLSDNRIAGDVLTLNYTSASFANKNVGTGKTVSVSGITVTGTDASNYTFNTTATTTANIAARALTVSATGANKVYDGTTAATVTLSDDRVSGDVFTTTYTSATFDNKHVGTGKTVSVSGISISGADAGNYTVNATASTTANITAAPLTITAVTYTRMYDGTTSAAATPTVTGLQGSDTVTGLSETYDNRNVGTGKTLTVSPGYTVNDGNSGNNYTVTTVSNTTGVIIQRTLHVTAAGVNKVYDTTTTAMVTLSDDRVSGDSLTTGYTSASFADKNVGTGKSVSVSGISISGTDASNYNLANTTASTTADITKASLTVTATGTNKVYDATTTATVTLADNHLGSDVVTLAYTSATFADKNVGTAKPVSVSGISISGADAGNYNLANTTAATTADITAKAASVTPNAASKTYGDADPSLTGTLSGFLEADGVTATYSRTTGETVAGSPYTISTTLSPAAVLGNYTITYNTATFTIAKRTASVTPNAASKTYGDADPTPLTTGILTDFVAADNVTATYSRAAGETVAGGPYTISATLAPVGVLSNYTITYNTANFTIDPKAASVTPNAASKTYGDADPVLTGTLSGFLTGDSVTAAYSRTAGETVAGSPYTISATLSPAGVLSNYSITYNTTNFTINKATASVTPNAASKTYGSTDPALTGTLSGFLASDNVSATYSRAAGETVAGNPYPISATLSPAGVLGNYDITYHMADFTIHKAPASVMPNAASKTYGAADPPLTGTLSGFLAADGVTATYSRTTGETVLGGPYTISATLSPVGALSNYSITYNTANFTIDPKAASVTPNAASKTYGTADPVFTGTLAGFVAADGVTASYSRTAGETVAGSPYTISATLSPAGVLSNYSITYNTTNFTINKATASVTPNAASKTYGDADPALTGTLTNFVAADGVTATYSRTAGETVAGSPYTISATLSPAGVLSNYDITYNTATFTINKRLASVTPVAASKTYGDADPALTGTLINFVATDGVMATYSRTAGETVAGSPYTISATLSPAGVLSNYTITYNTASFTIDPKAASVTPNAVSKTYGTADPALTGTLSGFLATDGVTASYSRTAGETVAGSPYTISATLSPAGVLSNYSITYNTANFTISKKVASVTPDAKSKVYGAADPTLTGTLSGFLASDGVTATYSRTAGETVAGGPYTISATLAPVGVLSNYSITYNTANFTITSWTVQGFYSPVDMGGILNTVKGGSTVPLKFEIFAGSTEQTATSAISSFTADIVSCNGGSEDPIPDQFLTTGGTSLRYDLTAGQFIQNWQTPKVPGRCYKITMKAADGSSIWALFKLK